MPKPTTFVELIDLWKRPPLLAARLGYPTKRVYKMRERNFIEMVHWSDIIRVVREDHDVAVTLDDLHAMAMATLHQRGSVPAKKDAA